MLAEDGYLKPGDPESKGSNGITYHFLLIPSSVQLKEPIAIAYADSLTTGLPPVQTAEK